MIGQVGGLYDLQDGSLALLERHELFADMVGVPVGRVLAWAVARLVEAALWHVSRGEKAEAHDSMRVATRLAHLARL